MLRRTAALVFAAALLAPAARADSWWRANFHAHTADSTVGDDGSELPAALHAALRARGFAFSVHTPHSTLATGPGASGAWSRERATEGRLSDRTLTVSVGQELTVAPGPAFRARTEVLGHEAPGNLDHLSLVGTTRFVPSGTPVAEACRAAHEGGGVCIVNHPGPGPMMWEEGLWEAPANRGLIDGLEVYNGQALTAVGIDFEARYREATAYRGLGLKIAAVTGADTHGPSSVKRARSRLHAFGKAAEMLERLIPPGGGERPELDAATLVLAPSPSEAAIVAAVRSRRTVAVFRLDGLTLDAPGLGQVRTTGDVKLHVGFSRPVGEVTLYREGEPVRSWHNAREVDFAETITRPAAYVFSVRDGYGRMLTSATWFEPPESSRTP